MAIGVLTMPLPATAESLVLGQCLPTGPCGDVDGSGELTASDALRTLKGAVGAEVEMVCECESAPTTTTTVPVGARFHDNGDGTVSDTETQLMWEVLTTFGSLHNVNLQYTFDEANMRISALNASNFAGYGNWRAPTLAELKSLSDILQPTPKVDVAFNRDCSGQGELECDNASCSCTSKINGYYWSTTVHSGYGKNFVYNSWSGSQNEQTQTQAAFSRAVRYE